MKKWGIVIVVGLTVLGAIGASPRYIEELRIGGGYGDTVDGGADFEKDGTISMDGALTVGGAVTVGGDVAVNGGDITSTGNLTLDPNSGSGTVTTTGDLAVTGGDITSTGGLYVHANGGDARMESTSDVEVTLDSDNDQAITMAAEKMFSQYPRLEAIVVKGVLHSLDVERIWRSNG